VSTYLAQWELLTWMLLGNMAVFGALLIAFLKYRPEVGLPVVKQDWTANAAIPSFYLGTLAVALSFSLVADGDFNFGGRLNQLGGERLPALGHYQQAEKILAYLEEHPEHAREELLLNKGKLLALMGRPEEATAAFEAALAAELERYAEVPETAEVSRRLGLIYSSLGDSALSTSHFNAALEINRAAVDADEAPERRAQMYTQRAEIFADMGHHERAIVEYLSASKLVVSESMRHDIGQEIRQSLTECGRQDGNVTAEVDGAHRQSLDWEQVEQMARQLDQEHDAAAWCS
jgi:tetratricopeptide (TPR) repeat protein